eukprot:COSAG01_NODE_5303_length_4350_cov_14.343213_3_plen_134_part_00
MSAGSCSDRALALETIQIPLTSRTAVAATAPPEGVAASGGLLGHFRVVEQAPGFRCDLTGGPQSGRPAVVDRSEAAAGESFLRVHWVAVPKAVRARRTNRWADVGGPRRFSGCPACAAGGQGCRRAGAWPPKK